MKKCIVIMLCIPSLRSSDTPQSIYLKNGDHEYVARSEAVSAMEKIVNELKEIEQTIIRNEIQIENAEQKALDIEKIDAEKTIIEAALFKLADKVTLPLLEHIQLLNKVSSEKQEFLRALHTATSLLTSFEHFMAGHNLTVMCTPTKQVSNVGSSMVTPTPSDT